MTNDTLPEDWDFYVTDIQPQRSGLSQTIFVCDVPMFDTPSLIIVSENEEIPRVVSFDALQTDTSNISKWFKKNREILLRHWNQQTSSNQLYREVVSL